VGKVDGKRPLVKPKHRWKDIIIHLKEIAWEGMD
jgi:hypothetical protein